MAATGNALALAGPESRKLYASLLEALQSVGPFEIEVKKTSIHLVRKSAFAGVAPRKQYLLLTIKASEPIESSRIFKSEQASKHRWHLETRIASAEEIDAELLGWLRESYEISA